MTDSFSKTSTFNYGERVLALQNILKNFESDELSLDNLSSSLEQAYALIESLRKHLTGVEAQIDSIISTQHGEEHQ